MVYENRGDLQGADELLRRIVIAKTQLGDLQRAVESLRQAIVIADAQPECGLWQDMRHEKRLELEAALTRASRPLPATVADDDDVPADDHPTAPRPQVAHSKCESFSM